MKTLIKISISCFVALIMMSCEKEESTSFDKELFKMATSNIESFTWYKNSNALLVTSDGSGHTQPFLRTRYNTIASQMLNNQGLIIDNATFAEGSLIVKELIDDDGNVELYAILFKDSDNDYADSKGWVWGYIEADGSVRQSVSKKGSSCISCHSQLGNIDYMLMNKYFP